MHVHYEKFVNKIHDIYGTQADEVLSFPSAGIPTTFRVNTLRFESNAVLTQLKAEGFVFKNGPLRNSYIVQGGPIPLSQSTLFSKGAVYIQELSSMIPPIVLCPRPGDDILDLCAAPGSKTTQLAELINDQGNIIAVERDVRRYQRLMSVLALHGTQSVRSLLADGYSLTRRFPQYKSYFDVILLDAPCSNESYFDPTDPEAFSFWSPRRVKLCSNVQKGLLLSAVAMLRPGGKLAYSTCTYSVEENEMVLTWLLKKIHNVRLIPIELNEAVPTVSGIIHYKDKHFDQSVSLARRVIPRNSFRGFFVALLEKYNE